MCSGASKVSLSRRIQTMKYDDFLNLLRCILK